MVSHREFLVNESPTPHMVGKGTLIIAITAVVAVTLTLGLLLRLLRDTDGL